MRGIPPAPIVERFKFRPYRPGRTRVPVRCVTPADGYYVHTFYDVCPFSPCGRYLALTRLPYQGRRPVLGELADVSVVDLEDESVETVYRTPAWAFQLGAQVQWGPESEHALYANDVVEGRGVCVRIDLRERKARLYAGPKYDLAPDASYAVGPDLALMNATQYGYGIPDPPGESPPRLGLDDLAGQGIWRTDLASGEVSLLVSLERLAAAATSTKQAAGGIPYCFHTKLNRQGTRLLQVLRCLVPGRAARNACLLSLDPGGRDVREVVDRRSWSTRGRLGGTANHPNWHPDGERMVLNLVPRSLGHDDVRFCTIRFDGSDLRVLSERHAGSGHPSVDPSGRYLLSDAYPRESWVVSEDREIPIRILHLDSDEEVRICSVAVDMEQPRNASPRPAPRSIWQRARGVRAERPRSQRGSHFKLDPHPAWSRDSRRVCFNGAPDGRRQVFVADVSKLL
ncbi:MAG: hypothetical protein JRG76_04195 [Deltaproteobacteria bacterium]|nr:hypothetical protein [Deltaproteobacteria bacterium]MBW2413691.1 hypothetical protein [Deltaproteobacteria bacterium]